MAVSSTIGNVYKFTGSLLSLQTGGLLDVSVLNTAGGQQTATFIEDDGRLTQASDGVATVALNGGAPQAVDYIGAGSASTATVLGIKLFSKPVMAFSAGGQIYLHFPQGLPPLSGLLITFDIKPGAGFDLPNPMPICLAQGTRVRTPVGERAVESLVPGDLVLTLDHGPQPVRWIGRRRAGRAEQRQEPRLRAVRIAAGALGPGCPARDLLVTQQHRILLRPGREEEVLAAARHLTGRPGVALEPPLQALTYHHLLFDRHEVILAEGCATESLFLGPQAMLALPPEARQEILLLFPELTGAQKPPAARPFLTRREAAALPALAGCG